MTYFTGASKVVFILSLFLFTSCGGYYIKGSQASGVYHLVRKGETLYSIARAYNINAQYLAKVNNIDAMDHIKADSAIFIPHAQQVIDAPAPTVKTVEASKRPGAKSEPRQKKETGKEDAIPAAENGTDLTSQPVQPDRIYTEEKMPGASPRTGYERPGEKDKPPVSAKKTPAATPAGDKAAEEGKKTLTPGHKSIREEDLLDDEQKKIRLDKKHFAWPVQGKLVSRFGMQPNGMFLNGIRIAVPVGTPVLAAADGTVIFSDPMKDYGETIILKHDDDFATVYSYSGERLVKLNDRVKKRDLIGTLAGSASKGDPVVNFEVRLKNKARNPVFYLP